LRIRLLKVAAVIAQHAAHPAVPGLALAQRANLRPRDEPAAIALKFIQRMACAMTPKRPATQAGVGVVTRQTRAVQPAGP